MSKRTMQSQLGDVWKETVRLRVILFLVLLVALYGFIGLRIKTLANVQPSESQVISKGSSTARPHLDQAVVDKVRQLQESSATVQTLFDQARQNPFRE